MSVLTFTKFILLPLWMLNLILNTVKRHQLKKDERGLQILNISNSRGFTSIHFTAILAFLFLAFSKYPTSYEDALMIVSLFPVVSYVIANISIFILEIKM